jgi:hypothetical protein
MSCNFPGAAVLLWLSEGEYRYEDQRHSPLSRSLVRVAPQPRAQSNHAVLGGCWRRSRDGGVRGVASEISDARTLICRISFTIEDSYAQTLVDNGNCRIVRLDTSAE